MYLYRILRILISVISRLTFILTPIFTFILGLIGSVPLIGAVFILVISLIWIVLFYFPLVIMSWISVRARFLSPIIAIVAIPLSLCAYLYAVLMPSFGDWTGRFSKILFASIFPYNFHFYRLTIKELPPDDYFITKDLEQIFEIESRSNPLLSVYIGQIKEYLW